MPEPFESARSNGQGMLALKIDIGRHPVGVGIYAIRQRRGRPLVGVCKATKTELDKPITITMHPACRVLFRIDSTGLAALESKYHAQLTGPGWWRAAYVFLGAGINGSPQPLFATSRKGELEFLLPPGQFTIFAYGADVIENQRSIEIKPDDRELVLGTFDLLPSPDAENGKFPLHHRVRRSRSGGLDEVSFRRIQYLPLRGVAHDAHDVAFSPDGQLLATAHARNEGPGEVILWDMTGGAKLATLPVADRGVASVAFSPDGKLLAGRAHALGLPDGSGEVVVWDVAARREVHRTGGQGGWISALEFSPDGKILASSDSDQSLRFWDIVSGREIRRIDDVARASELAYSPDGRIVVLAGAGGALRLWDVVANRLRAAPEPDTSTKTATGSGVTRFVVNSIAVAPDGRTLAVAGETLGANSFTEEAQVRLYDLAHEPFARRAVLIFDRHVPGVAVPNDHVTICSDVAFTPDGRHIVAVAMNKFRIWDSATGAEVDAFERNSSGSSDRIAVSPDGRWLAVTSPLGAGVTIIDISPAPP